MNSDTSLPFILRDVCLNQLSKSELPFKYWKNLCHDWLELGLLDSEVYQIIEQDIILPEQVCSVSGVLLVFLKQQKPEKVSEIINKIRAHIQNGIPIFGDADSHPH